LRFLPGLVQRHAVPDVLLDTLVEMEPSVGEIARHVRSGETVPEAPKPTHAKDSLAKTQNFCCSLSSAVALDFYA